ncbi:hypothetical protein BJ123_101100 [Rhodopseudomonas thermotolerans]|uniref:Uncharacterized protein n=2 Tax=Rhodopseudomonas TaxID=1073 RepID=A0A336JNC8_9BRAD|nr:MULTISPECIES: hypothetical protein [Rhodopseudomonas]RED42383.1 hypothetical protein BJ125_101100 [Rhodopseudomonas pentothenatexigens]REG08173.1 hypothetical protein BJ123_101100 [Rhodopseudomonas thermotolerans]SSW88984.1 hypothetical protein SAMN05892882_101100 [Rhodopseudomonas pentothenatexigens]
MAPSVSLYAWAIPAWSSESPVDHTWVTSYDNQVHPYNTIADVVVAGQSFWYCWGSFHPQGGTPVNPTGALGQQAGNLKLAQCLVQANADSNTTPAARGTIYSYGVDGVCHQLANQVLYATADGGGPPLTVSKARGYPLSSYIYGTYGLQQTAWAAKVAACSGSQLVARLGRPGGLTVAASGEGVAMDEFEKRATELLATEPAKLASLLRLRGEVQRFAAQPWPGTGQPSAEALNARNQHLIDEAAKLLGPEHFRKLFAAEPGAKVTLVDPQIAATAGELPPPKPR